MPVRECKRFVAGTVQICGGGEVEMTTAQKAFTLFWLTMAGLSLYWTLTGDLIGWFLLAAAIGGIGIQVISWRQQRRGR